MILWFINECMGMISTYLGDEFGNSKLKNSLVNGSPETVERDKNRSILSNTENKHKEDPGSEDLKLQESNIFGEIEQAPNSTIKKIDVDDDGRIIKSYEKERIKIDASNIRQMLRSELLDLSPEVNEKIASSIESSNVDRNRYRDFFLIKKRIITDGSKKIVSFDIKERIIPKISESIFSNDRYSVIMLGVIMVLLFLLVLTTTMKTYETLYREKLPILRHMKKPDNFK